MIKKLQSIINKIAPYSLVAAVILLWQYLSSAKIVKEFMLPSPVKVLSALVSEAPLLISNAKITLTEAAIGLGASIAAALLFAVLMDRFKFVYKAAYPIAVISQTVPTVAIAPLLVLWFGYDMLPKIILIFITCFFPMLLSLLGGFQAVDGSIVRLYRSMGAGYLPILFHVKLPYAMESFFSGLRISVSYAIVGAVISEWLGGNGGLGVYMTRVRKSFAFDKMFAVIIAVSVLSLALMKLVDFLQYVMMPWKRFEKK